MAVTDLCFWVMTAIKRSMRALPIPYVHGTLFGVLRRVLAKVRHFTLLQGADEKKSPPICNVAVSEGFYL